jgi:hypothetical protein
MANNTNTKFHSSIQEQMVSSYLGWEVVSGSGSRMCVPGDVISDEWLGECKTHETSGHKIIFLADVWTKISDEAIAKFRYPCLFVDDGSKSASRTWVMFDCNRCGFLETTKIGIHSKFKPSLRFYHDDYVESLNNTSQSILVLGDNHTSITTLKNFKYLLEEC